MSRLILPIAAILTILIVAGLRVHTYGYDEIRVWVAAISTLSVLSFLYKENKVYRFAEHVMLGTSIGYNVAASIMDLLRSQWWNPMLDGFDKHNFGAIFFGLSALLFGLFWYGLFHPKTEWLSRMVMGVVFGAGAGLAIKQQFALNMPQITDSFKAPIVLNEVGRVNWPHSVNNMIFIVALLLTVNFFFFSSNHSERVGRVVERIQDRLPLFLKGFSGLITMLFTGRFWLMLAFGVFFGNTVMTRLSVFIERIWFLIQGWLQPIITNAPR